MELSLEKFKENVKDVARSNRFVLEFLEIPKGITFDEELRYFVKGASMPGRTFGDITVNWFGQQYKTAGDMTFEDFQVTFLNDYDYKIRKLIENWMENAGQKIENYRGLPGDYKGKIQVTQIGRSMDDLQKINLLGAYPKQMDQIELSMDNNDQAGEFQVTFAYDRWEIAAA